MTTLGYNNLVSPQFVKYKIFHINTCMWWLSGLQ